MRGLRVGIVGCGSAGPALGLFLCRTGHRVAIFERAPKLLPVGAGFVLQPTGLHVLEQLGLIAPVLEHGARIDTLRCDTSTGARVLDLHYREIHEDACGIGLHRAVLLSIFEKAIRDHDQLQLHLGVTIASIASEGHGRFLLADSGEHFGPFDLIVLADGSRSALRATLPVHQRVSPYVWGALWYIGPDPEQRFAGRLYQVVESAKTMLGFLPTGLGLPATDNASTKQATVDLESPRRDSAESLVSLFWSIRADRINAWRTAGIEAWKRDIVRLVPEAEPMLTHIEDPDEIAFARYFDVRMKRWHHDRTVIIGDAAHAMSPQLGQGVNLALWDAMVLADCINGADCIDEALVLYGRRRRVHQTYYARATRWLTPFFQSDSRLLGWMRNLGMGLAMRMGPMRRTMVQVMCGIERGFVFRRPMQMPPLATKRLPDN